MAYGENLFTANKLKEEEMKLEVTGVGNSMTPILKSRQSVIVSSFKSDVEDIKKNDIVFCKVNGHFYLHKVYAINGDQYQIGNNHGHINGWTNKKNIFGKVVEIL